MDATTESAKDPIPLENRPGIFIVGSSNVGKRTLLYRNFLFLFRSFIFFIFYFYQFYILIN